MKWWILVLAVLLVAGSAVAQPLASGTSFLPPNYTLDNFKEKAAGDTVPATEYDRLLSATNELEKRLQHNPPTTVACSASSVTLAAGNRDCTIRLVWQTPFPDTSYAAIPGQPVDTVAPARLVLDGIQAKTTTYIDVCVWNRDASAARTGTVCAIAR